MFWNVLRMERAKLFSRKLFWLELALIAAFFLLIGVSSFASYRTLSAGALQAFVWPGGLVTVLSITSFISIMLLIILVGTVTAQEYSWRTMQQWLSHGVSRPLLMSAKLLLFIVPMLLMVLASLLLGAGLMAILSLFVNGTLHADQVNFTQLFLGSLRVFYGLFPYVALTFMLAIVSRSTVAAVAGGLVFAAVVEPVVSQLLPVFGKAFAQVVQYLPNRLVQALLLPNSTISQVVAISGSAATQARIQAQNALLVSPTTAIIGITLYTLLFVVIAFWTFSRQDLAN